MSDVLPWVVLIVVAAFVFGLLMGVGIGDTSIRNDCRALGAFRSHGAVFTCTERRP